MVPVWIRKEFYCHYSDGGDVCLNLLQWRSNDLILTTMSDKKLTKTNNKTAKTEPSQEISFRDFVSSETTDSDCEKDAKTGHKKKKKRPKKTSKNEDKDKPVKAQTDSPEKKKDSVSISGLEEIDDLTNDLAESEAVGYEDILDDMEPVCFMKYVRQTTFKRG